MPKSLGIKTLILGFILLISCRYSPTDLEYKEIPELIPPQVTADFFQFNDVDTIDVFERTRIFYRFQTDRGEIVGTTIYRDSIAVSFGTNHEGSYTVDPDENEESLELLTFEVRIKTNSRSLADLLEAEFFVATASKHLNIDTSPRNTPPRASIFIESGTNTPILVWRTYDGENFNNYKILRKTELEDDFRELEEIENINSTTFRDETLVGGDAQYIFKTTSFGITDRGDTLNFEGPKTTIDQIILQDRNATISWSENLYPNAFERYQLYQFEEGSGPSRDTRIFTSYSITDTEFTVQNLTQGTTYYFLIEVISENDEFTFTRHQKQLTVE